MTLHKHEADSLFDAWKHLLPEEKWTLKEANTGKETGRTLECLIEIDGAVRKGSVLLLSISAGNLDKCTMSVLARSGNGGHTRHPIYRLDINPSAAHRNPFVGNIELRGKRFLPGETHEHVYLDNLDDSGALLERCDTVARPISNPPATFKEGLDYIRDRIHLLNIAAIPAPETQGDLL